MKLFDIWRHRTIQWFCKKKGAVTWHVGHWEQLNQVNGAGYQRTIRGPSTVLGWCIKLGTLSNAPTYPCRPSWSNCAGAVDKKRTCHIWLKQSLIDPIASSPKLLISFLSSTGACRISWSNVATWPHWPACVHYLTCFLCGEVKQSVKLKEKHYTCLLEQAGGTAIDRLKRKGMDLRRVKVRTGLTSGDKSK